MEEVSSREGESLADSKRRSGLAQRKIDEYDDDSGLHAEIERNDARKGERVPGGSGESPGHSPGDGEHQRDDSSRMGCYRVRGQILATIQIGYPCAGCPGGLDYRVCCELRGVKK